MSSRVQPRPGALQVEKRTDGRRRLLREIRVDVSTNVDRSRIVCVPPDFVTDYSSLPWGTRWFMHWSRVDVAGVVHDYLYRCGADDSCCYTKAEADRIWRWVALAGNRRALLHQAWLGWLFLRLFGWCFFRRRDVWAYTDKPTASEKCQRTWTTRAAHFLVFLALSFAVLTLMLTLPKIRGISRWMADIYHALRELLWQPTVPLLLVFLLLLWILPGNGKTPVSTAGEE